MELQTEIFSLFDKQWALLTSGTLEDHNTMTVSWGGLGTIWNKPVATVYVRPNRHTYSYMEKNEYFTVSFYPEECRKDLALLGRLSGKDCNKEAQTSLKAVAVQNGVSFDRAQVTVICKKIYCQDLDGNNFPEEIRERFYGKEPVHRMYIGEIVDIIK